MKKRTVVFVRSLVSGRVAVIKATPILMGPMKQPVVEGLSKDVKFTPVEFDGSDQAIDGIKRYFWVADLTQADFRWLLSHRLSSNWEGSDSFFRIYPADPTKDLIQKAFDNLPQIVAETKKQTAA